MPQHELLACAQCGCFAFSCFEDFAIRVNYRMSINNPFQGSLFANDFLCESIVESPDWRAIDDMTLDTLEPPSGTFSTFFRPGRHPMKARPKRI